MPYIKPEKRLELLRGEKIPLEAGELNFILTHYITEYLHENGECYQTYNDILGALEGAKLELYRRKVVGYENQKIEQNGDVY